MTADERRREVTRRAGYPHVLDVAPFAEVPAGDEHPALACTTDLSAVPRGQIGACLAWLRTLSRPVAVSCTLAPVRPGRATLLAPSTWRVLLEAHGLEVRAEHRETSSPTSAPWAADWQAADPWRAGALTALHLLLVPSPAHVDAAVASSATRTLAGPQHTRLASDRRLGFLVSGSQDFHTLAPWVDRLAPKDIVIVVRDATFGTAPRTASDLLQASAALGPSVVATGADLASDLHGAGIEVLISASESPANLAHQGNAAALLIARQLGIATAHAQHGIWPRAEFPPPIVSVADVVLAWAAEYGEVVRTDGAPQVVGAPRFDRYADAERRTRAGLYGAWADRFERHVVLATNLHWGAHTQRVDARGLVLQVATHAPRTLVTWKPHPHEPAPSPADLPDNVVVASEAVMLAAGLEFADLLEASDALVCTPSTVALEAALAGVPYFVVATGNPNRHVHVDQAPLDELERWLDAPALPAAAMAYAAHYCAPSTRGVALGLALQALRDLTPRPLPPGVALTLSGLYQALAGLGAQTHHLQAAQAAAARYVDSLTWTLARKDQYIATLRGEEPTS